MSSDNQRVVSAQVNQSLDSDSIPRSDDPVSLSLAETKVSRLQAMIEKQIEQINFLAEENHELRLRLDFGDDLPAAEPVVHESARGLSSETESKVISINKKQDMRDVTIATIAEIAEDRTGVETGLTPLLEVSTKTAVVTAPVTDASSEKPPTDQLQQTLDRGYQAYNQGDYSAASLWYQRASGLDPMNRDANLGLAAIAGASEQQLTAIGIYRQLLLADPDDQVAFASLLRFASAENEIETELRLHIEQRAAVPAVLHRTFGDYYSRTLQWTRARDAYEQSLLLNTAADVYFNLGISLEHLGQRREAAMRYRQALEAEGESSFDRQLAQDRLSTIGTLD